MITTLKVTSLLAMGVEMMRDVNLTFMGFGAIVRLRINQLMATAFRHLIPNQVSLKINKR